MQIEITLKSGAQITADVEEFTTSVNRLGDVVGIKWTTPPDSTRKLVDVDLTQIAAIVRVGGVEDTENPADVTGPDEARRPGTDVDRPL